MNELKERFLDLSPRDQLMLVVGVGAVVIYILVFMVLLPMQESLEQKQKRNAAALGEQQRVQELAAKVLAVKESGGTTNSGQNLNTILNDSLREHGLRMENFQPTDNSARVRLASAEFNKVLAWLRDLEITQGLQVKDLSVTADNNPGAVLVNVQLQQGE